MAAMPPAGRNPFGPVDAGAVVAALRATGSFDPDVLYATKRRLLAPYRDLRRLAALGVLLGATLVVTRTTPLIGGLVLLASATLWAFQARQVAHVKAGYAQYLASAKS